MSSPEIFARRESRVRSYCRNLDAVLVGGSGSEVWDAAGRGYIDFLGGAGSLNYGHNDPDMKQALVDFILGDGIAQGLDFHTGAKMAFLERFERLILRPRGMTHVVQFTGPTGTGAVEAALRLARKVTGRTSVIAFTRAFHGVSLGALAASGNSRMRGGPVNGLGNVVRLPYDGYLGGSCDTADLAAGLLADPSSGMDRPAAIVLETVQGEGGLRAASFPWLRRIAALAAEHRALLIVDDIQAGCGRTGTFFSFEPAGISPDIVTLSKSLSGFGLPMSAVLIKPECDRWEPGEHTGTFRGNAHAFVTARVALEKFWSSPSFANRVGERAAVLTERLRAIAAEVPGAFVKGRGMMQGIELDAELAGLVVRDCVQHGLIIERAGPRDEVVKVLAPLTTPEDVLERGLDILADAVRRVVPAARPRGLAVVPGL